MMPWLEFPQVCTQPNAITHDKFTHHHMYSRDWTCKYYIQTFTYMPEKQDYITYTYHHRDTSWFYNEWNVLTSSHMPKRSSFGRARNCSCSWSCKSPHCGTPSLTSPGGITEEWSGETCLLSGASLKYEMCYWHQVVFEISMGQNRVLKWGQVPQPETSVGDCSWQSFL